MKKKTKKRKNPADTTMRNIRALQKRVDYLEDCWKRLIEAATERAEKKVEHIIKLGRK